MTYSEKLKDPRWQKKRLEILSRDNWTCKYCGDTKATLHVHHLKYNGAPWNASEDDLETVCCVCHDIISNSQDHPIISCKKHVYHNGLSIVFSYHFNTEKDIYFVCVYEHKNGKTEFKTLFLEQELKDFTLFLKEIKWPG